MITVKNSTLCLFRYRATSSRNPITIKIVDQSEAKIHPVGHCDLVFCIDRVGRTRERAGDLLVELPDTDRFLSPLRSDPTEQSARRDARLESQTS